MSKTDDDENRGDMAMYVLTLAAATAHRLYKHDSQAAYPAALGATAMLGLQLGLDADSMAEMLKDICIDYEAMLQHSKEELN